MPETDLIFDNLILFFDCMEYMIINDEKCLPIVGFERYHVSESGRVYRTDVNKKRSWRTKGKQYINEKKIHYRYHNGKLRQALVSLSDFNGKLHNLTLAPLILMTFGIISKKLKRHQTVGYKDGNRKNLHYTNLEVIEETRQNCKLTLEDVKHIKKQIKKGIPLNRIGFLFGVSEMQINRIKTGENWGNGKRKIKAPEAPFEIKDGRLRKYIATFDREKTIENVRKPFTVKRNPKKPTDNTIYGILRGYKLSLKHTNITRARAIVDKLNAYFFENAFIDEAPIENVKKSKLDVLFK